MEEIKKKKANFKCLWRGFSGIPERKGTSNGGGSERNVETMQALLAMHFSIDLLALKNTCRLFP